MHIKISILLGSMTKHHYRRTVIAEVIIGKLYCIMKLSIINEYIFMMTKPA